MFAWYTANIVCLTMVKFYDDRRCLKWIVQSLSLWRLAKLIASHINTLKYKINVCFLSKKRNCYNVSTVFEFLINRDKANDAKNGLAYHDDFIVQFGKDLIEAMLIRGT